MHTKFTAFVIIFLLTFTAIFSSCIKEEELEGKEYSPDIHGKWKLIAASYWDGEPIRLYYHQHKIIYDFNDNNVLTVSGDMDTIDDYRGHGQGKYSYQILPIPGGFGLFLPQIKIGTEKHGFSFGWVFYDFYEGPAMHLNTENGTLVLIRVS